MMTPAEIEDLFSRADGAYAFARWGRPIAPIVFGVEDETLKTVKGALEAVVTLAGHQMAETDPELGANLMLFFFRDWDELLEVPDLGRLIPDLDPLVARLKQADASQYRAFRFDDQGGIQACFTFLRMSGDMARLPAETLALTQAVQAMLTWGDSAFAETSPLAVLPDTGATILRPEIAGVIAAAYDRMMPVSAADSSHALRLFARLQAPVALPADDAAPTTH
ncbi:hypothetical protein [Phaeobacter inhibens]|uniref:hypothetical protein n=1 Tax=Phaeobacter inhibens TaxID=221822 RepID=UPI000C9A1CED|nr:hypothetical protein [Phaeobacter inhibens]AUQ53282.1 hypothetical protein PhaeoP92_00576 [Phaeobacter inhibens]AUQ77298.1 hypothetical protein PhaeoP74_00577 [Phaeobacter inhibens]AUR14457.1 hypothetical protein PhaeoP70_00575 [Phaeobacter inhibens]